jgi:hypothetical protein
MREGYTRFRRLAIAWSSATSRLSRGFSTTTEFGKLINLGRGDRFRFVSGDLAFL